MAFCTSSVHEHFVVDSRQTKDRYCTKKMNQTWVWIWFIYYFKHFTKKISIQHNYVHGSSSFQWYFYDIISHWFFLAFVLSSFITFTKKRFLYVLKNFIKLISNFWIIDCNLLWYHIELQINSRSAFWIISSLYSHYRYLL